MEVQDNTAEDSVRRLSKGRLSELYRRSQEIYKESHTDQSAIDYYRASDALGLGINEVDNFDLYKKGRRSYFEKKLA